MKILTRLTNAISPKPISKTKGSSFTGSFSQTWSTIGYELWLKNSDIMSITRLISDNIYTKIHKPEQNFDLFANIELLKYEFVKNKILWWEFVVVPVSNILDKVIWFEIFWKNRYVIQYNDLLEPIGVKIRYNNQSLNYDISEVLYICYNNDNQWKPKWIIDDIIEDLCIDLEASNSIKEYYKNRLALSFFLKLWQNADSEKLSSEIQKFLSWSKNAWKFLASTDIDAVQQFQATWLSTQLDREYVSEKICAVLNIPKEILWYTQKWWSEAKIVWLLEIFDGRIMKPRNIKFQDLLDKIISKWLWEIDPKYAIKSISVVINNKVSIQETKIIIEQVRAGIITTAEARDLLWLNK